MPRRRLIQFRRGLANIWRTTNPILSDGEPGWDSSARILKMGDGTRSWRHLPGTVFVTLTPSGDVTGVIDTIAIQMLIDSASATTPVHITLTEGVFYVFGLVLRSYVTIKGAARALTTLQLPNGANTDILSTEDFATLTGGTTQGGPHSWSIKHLTLHGNRANNTTGWPLRVYGRRYEIVDVLIRDGNSGGFYSQWGIGGTYMGAHISDLTLWNNDGDNMDFGGPQDSVIHDLLVFTDSNRPAATDRLLYVHGLGQGTQFSDVHVYGNCESGIVIDTPSFWTNTKAQAGGGALRSVHALSDYIIWTNGWIAGTSVGVETGLEIGDATTAPKGCRFTDVFFSRFLAGSSPIKWTDTNGYNEITGTILADTDPATEIETGTRHVTDRVAVRSPTNTALDPGAAPVDRIFIPATTLFANAGSPDMPVTTYPVLRFDAASAETATRVVELPGDWPSYTAVVWWTNGGAGVGNVKWNIGAAEITDGAAFGAFTTRSPAAEAAPAGSTAATTASGTAWTVTSRIQYIRLQRDAANAADTLANDANVLGIELIRAS